MLYAVNTNVSVTSGNNVPFNIIYLTNNNTAWSGDTASLKVPGYYKVHFDGTGSPDAAGNVEITAILNGVASSTALAEVSSTGPADIVNLSFDTIVKIVNSPAGIATLSLRNSGADSTFIATNLIIERIA